MTDRCASCGGQLSRLVGARCPSCRPRAGAPITIDAVPPPGDRRQFEEPDVDRVGPVRSGSLREWADK